MVATLWQESITPEMLKMIISEKTLKCALSIGVEW